MTILKAIFGGDAQRGIVAAAFVVVVFLILYTVVWTSVGANVRNNKTVRLKLRDIYILDPPEWVDKNFVAESFALHPELSDKTHAGDKGVLSILEKDLITKMTVAFESHPWTERVESIRIEYPPKVTVAIRFRRPIAVVGAPEEYESSYKGGGFPIDAGGVLLPIEYFQRHSELLYNYIWIRGIKSSPMRSYGEPWNDPLVIESAMLAEFLDKDRKTMGIRDIVVKEKPDREPGGVYELVTTGGTKIVWGDFPLSGSLPARDLQSSPERFEKIKETVQALQEKKLTHLRLLVSQYGSLDKLPKEKKPIDVSRM